MAHGMLRIPSQVEHLPHILTFTVAQLHQQPIHQRLPEYRQQAGIGECLPALLAASIHHPLQGRLRAAVQPSFQPSDSGRKLQTCALFASQGGASGRVEYLVQQSLIASTGVQCAALPDQLGQVRCQHGVFAFGHQTTAVVEPGALGEVLHQSQQTGMAALIGRVIQPTGAQWNLQTGQDLAPLQRIGGRRGGQQRAQFFLRIRLEPDQGFGRLAHLGLAGLQCLVMRPKRADLPRRALLQPSRQSLDDEVIGSRGQLGFFCRIQG